MKIYTVIAHLLKNGCFVRAVTLMLVAKNEDGMFSQFDDWKKCLPGSQYDYDISEWEEIPVENFTIRAVHWSD